MCESALAGFPMALMEGLLALHLPVLCVCTAQAEGGTPSVPDMHVVLAAWLADELACSTSSTMVTVLHYLA